MENVKHTNTEIKLKKKKKDKYDARGIQTLFRTLSINHYNLLKMVDNKVRIILTVNSIITSLLLGILFIAPKTQRFKIENGTRILLVCSMLSIVVALFSILPHRYFGKAYKKSTYKEVLYAEKFSSLSLEEFKSASKLSRGQQQRVAIARALINHPKIIMCDEPTGNLDSKNTSIVLETFHQLSQEFGQTIIAVTHDNDFAEASNRIIELADGKLI